MSIGKGIALAAPWGAVAVAVSIDPFAGVMTALFALFATFAIAGAKP